MPEDVRCKVGGLVREDLVWQSYSGKDGHQRISHGSRPNIGKSDCLRIAVGIIHHGEDVLLAGLCTLQRADNIDSYNPEGLTNNRKRNKWCPIVTQNMGGALTWFTGGTILRENLEESSATRNGEESSGTSSRPAMGTVRPRCRMVELRSVGRTN